MGELVYIRTSGSIFASQTFLWKAFYIICPSYELFMIYLRGVEWVHGLFLFPLVLGKM